MNKDVWDDIGRAVTGAADTVSRKASELATGAADTVSRKASELADTARLKNQIYSLEREIRKDYEALGKLVYDRYTEEGCTEKPFEELCEEIARREILIDQYEGELEDRKK